MKLSGRRLFNSLRVDLDSRRSAVENPRWSVKIGELTLEPKAVQLLDSQTLSVLLPPTLELGVLDVVVTTPGGALATLNDGLTVIDGDPSTSSNIEPATMGTASLASTGATAAAASEPLSDSASTAGGRTDSALPTTDSSGTEDSRGPSTGASGTSETIASEAAVPDAGGGMDAAPGAASPELEALSTALAHRYSFEESGTTVLDSVGGADGTFVGGSLDGVSGAARFTGAGEYVNLPNGLISGRDAVTIEVWSIWDVPDSGPAHSWQRIFDFGSSSSLEGLQGSQDTHLFLSPRSGGPAGALHLAYRGDLTGSVTLNTTSPLTPAVVEHVAAVVDGLGGRMELFVNGVSVATRSLAYPLSSVRDHNNWLGRSQVLEDPSFRGRLFEFRIYDGALSAPILSASYAAGADAQL